MCSKSGHSYNVRTTFSTAVDSGSPTRQRGCLNARFSLARASGFLQIAARSKSILIPPRAQCHGNLPHRPADGGTDADIADEMGMAFHAVCGDQGRIAEEEPAAPLPISAQLDTPSQ